MNIKENRSRMANCAHVNLNEVAGPSPLTRRREASLTSGSVPWNRLPASFKRIHSAKSNSRNSMSPPPIPRQPTPKLQLQPGFPPRHQINRSCQEQATKKSIVVTLPTDSGAVRPKTANFPARNFLAGYRQIPPRGASRREVGSDGENLSRSSSILMLSPSYGNPNTRPDLDQMDDVELNQIFEELAAADNDEVDVKPKEKPKKATFGLNPEATEISGPIEIPIRESQTDSSSEVTPSMVTSSQLSAQPTDLPPDGYSGARTTPVPFRPSSGIRNQSVDRPSNSGKIVQTYDNLVYVPRPKTRLCRVYVGSTVVKPTIRGRPLEFLPVNRQANLYSRSDMKSKPSSSKPDKPLQYSTNFSSSYELKHGYPYPYTNPSTPEPDCIMCQHYLNR